MSLRDAYKQKLKAQFEEQKARLGALKAHAKRVAADGRIVAYEDLAQAERRLEQFASKVKKTAGAGWEALGEVRQGMDKALDDLSVSTKRAAARFSESTARPAAAKARSQAAPRKSSTATNKAEPKKRQTKAPKARPSKGN
jgi:hypothetical protein